MKYRGREIPPSRYEFRFWDRFPELLMDDPDEDEHNNLIALLRNVAINYFKRKDDETNKSG